MENLNKAILIRNGNVIGTMGDKYFSTAPLGTVLSFAGQAAPHGYLLCDGASYKVADYSDLYAVIGNTYGGDTENFNVPNLVDKFIQGSTASGTEKEAGLPNITGSISKTSSSEGDNFLSDTTATSTSASGALYVGSYKNVKSMSNGESAYNSPASIDFNASLSNPIYGNSDTVQPPALTMVYIIKAFHTNEGVDSGVSDDVVEYVEGEIAEVETALPNIKKFANPSGTARYITISGATLGDIEVHSAYAGKYMFTSTGAKPIFFGTSTYLGYTLTGWAWNSDKTKLYLRVNGHRDFVISAFGSDGVEISDMTTTAPTDVTFDATFNYNAYIDNSTSENTSTYSSAKIDKKFAPRHFGTDNKTLWLKLQLGAMTTHEPIIVTDQYGGQVKILGMYDLSTYKSVKVIRLSYGDWSTHSGTDVSTTTSGDGNYKIRRLFYCPDDNNYYLEIRQYAYISVEGAPDATMVTSLPVEESAMTLIPESQFAAKSDLATKLDKEYITGITDANNAIGENGINVFVMSASSTNLPLSRTGVIRSYTTIEDKYIRVNQEYSTIDNSPQNGGTYKRYGSSDDGGATFTWSNWNFVGSIDDSTTASLKTWSSSKINEEITNRAVSITGATINDSATNTTSVWSSSKTKSYVDTLHPSYTSVAKGASIDTGWKIKSVTNGDMCRIAVVNIYDYSQNSGGNKMATYLYLITANYTNTTTLNMIKIVSTGNTETDGLFEFSVSSNGTIVFTNKSSAATDKIWFKLIKP